MIRQLILGVGVAGVLCLATGAGVAAISQTEAKLQQEIEPFVCTYTATQTGSGVTYADDCTGQPVPIVESVAVASGRPTIRGTYPAVRAVMLRVWVATRWYTLGVDPQLKHAGDAWLLDLTDNISALPAGVYEIVVEVETSDGLLLRNTEAGAFVVPAVESPVQRVGGYAAPLLSRSGFVFPSSIPPREDSVTSDVDIVPVRDEPVRDTGALRATEPRHDSMPQGVVTAMAVAAVSAVLAVATKLLLLRLHR